MTIAVIGAMQEEITALTQKLSDPQTTKTAALEFFHGKMGNNNIIIVQSGIGKVNAAICAQTLICCHKADVIINTGVAGGISNDLNIGDIVISADLIQHDMDATHFGYRRGEVPRLNHDGCFKADNELISHALTAAKELFADINVIKGRIASGDRFVSESGIKRDIQTTFEAHCVEMEGAAIAQVCYLNAVPFIAIRSISDKADEAATVSFDQFVQTAAHNSSMLVERMISKIV
jgi:adenosylhomocysteine nucleosidase